MFPDQHLHDSMNLMWAVIDERQTTRCALALFTLFSLEETAAQHAPMLNAGEFWSAIAQALDNDEIMEKGLPKVRAEYIVCGDCYLPEPQYASAVNVNVGPLSKTLLIFGLRRWGNRGIERLSRFDHMPINSQHAYGGPEFRLNPVGIGHPSTGNKLLPNIEDPNHLMASSSDSPNPAGLRAMPPHGAQRSKLLGSFNADWRTNRWPFLPADTDPEYANAAPPDQRFPGFLKGDEFVSIENMHPERRLIEARLPGQRARLFCKRRGTTFEQEFEEIPLRPDTLWLLPNIERGVLLFRGIFDAADEECADVELFHAVWEPLNTQALPESHYREQLARTLQEEQAQEQAAQPSQEAGEAGEDDPHEDPEPTDGAAKAPETSGVQPKAALSAAAVPAAAGALGAETPPEIDALNQTAAELENYSAELFASLNVDAEQFQAAFEQARELENAEHKLGELRDVQSFIQSTGMSMEEYEALPVAEQLQYALDQFNERTRLFYAERGLEMPNMDKLAAMTGSTETPGNAEAMLKNSLATLREQGTDTSELESALAGLKKVENNLAALALPAAGAGVPESQEPLPAAPAPQPPARKDLPADLEEDARTKAQRLCKEGTALREVQLPGADLSELDLSGCDLRKADLRGANLENCNLSKADLRQSLLDEAQLSGANCTQAQFGKASLVRVSAQGLLASEAHMAHADMSGAEFVECDFHNSDFNRAELTDATFEKCDCRHAVFHKTQAQRAVFASCDLSSADFAQAELTEAFLQSSQIGNANFQKAQAQELRLSGAQGTSPDFSYCDLRGARGDRELCLHKALFAYANLANCCLESASLIEADFSRANLDAAALNNADLTGASLSQCRMRGIDLSKARLEASTLKNSNLFEGSLRKAHLQDADLRHSNLYGVNFYLAKIRDTKMQSANLKHTLLKHSTS